MRINPFLIMAFFGICGCKTLDPAANFYLARAESTLEHARKESKQGHVKINSKLKDTYQAACDLYTEAYYRNHRVFDWDAIADAADACMMGRNFENAKSFIELKERYEARPENQWEARRLPSWAAKAPVPDFYPPPEPPSYKTGTKPVVKVVP